MARRTWSSLFRSLFGGISGNQTKQAQRANLLLEQMEDRTTPAVNVTLIGGSNDLQLTFGAANDTATINNDGTFITVNYTGDGGTPFSTAATGVSQITVTDPSNSANQSLFITGSAYTLNGGNGLSASGVEQYSINSDISGSQVFLDVNSTISLGAGQFSTTSGQQYLGQVTLTTNTQMSAGSFINFGQTIDGGNDLALSATGNITFSGAIGGGTRLGAISITGASDVNAAAITAASFSQTAGSGTTTLGGNVDTNSGVGVSISTVSLAINGDVLTAANAGVTLTATNNININVSANLTGGSGGISLPQNHNKWQHRRHWHS